MRVRTRQNLCVVWNIGARRNPGRDELSEDKLEILDRILNLLSAQGGERPVVVLAGAAGTGKTTLMRVLIDELGQRGIASVLAAPTGKAAVRLAQVTGQPASTIHQTIFTNPVTAGICRKCETPSAELGVTERRIKRENLRTVECPECGQVYSAREAMRLPTTIIFQPKPPGVEATGRMVVIIDEASMVSKTLDRKIRETLAPNYAVLYVGDKEQLPPVGKPGSDDAAWGPDWANAAGTLTKVHRQAAGNPIIDLATRLRNDENRVDPFAFNDVDRNLPETERRVRVYGNMTNAQAARWLTAGRRAGSDATLITWTNRTRVYLNKTVRSLLGLNRGQFPVSAGDKLIVLNNNKPAGVMNGEIFNVSAVSAPRSAGLREMGLVYVTFTERPDKRYLIPTEYLNAEDAEAAKKEFLDFYQEVTGGYWEMRDHIRKHPDMSDVYEHALARYTNDQLWDEFHTVRPGALLMVDFGEAITAHKSQGSQWDTVGVIWDDICARRFNSRNYKEYEDARRWLYTAVTRAQRRLVIFDTTTRR